MCAWTANDVQTRLTAEQLVQLIAGYLNRLLDYAQPQAAAVADAYREAGWIVRAYSPEQKSFVATAVPTGGLPITLEITVAGQRTLMVIAERRN